MNGKTALVTGASSGIGLELARLLAADGHDLILTARRGDLLRQLADELTLAWSIRVYILPMDLSQPGAAAELWRAATALAPDIDVLVNNAGFGDATDFAHEDPERMDGMIQLNIAALTALSRLALRGMLARGRGRILHVASLAGMTPAGPGMAVYFATKSYVLSLSRALRREVSGSGVSVTALCPGATRTGFEEAAHADGTRLFRFAGDAGEVARAGYLGMQRGAALVVPGWINKALAVGARFAPVCLVIGINQLLLKKRR
jgi:short-subunit dehydrogenase